MRLLDYFSPLFAYGLAVDEQAAAYTPPSELAPLNARARELIDQARKLALANGKSMQDVELAGFAVVAWFDEIIVRHEAKRDQPSPLQLALFHTSDASSEFFEHLARLDSKAEEVREVYCTALMLGFVGQYYYEKGDGGELGRIKSVYCRPYAATAAVLQALQRESITPQPYLTPDSPARRRPGPWAGRRPALFVALGVVLLVLVAFVAPVFSSAIPAQAWYLAGILGVIAGMLGWAGSLAWHWLAITRASADPQAALDLRSVSMALKDAARRVRGRILHPFRRRGKWRQLSRHPWLMFLGDSDANMRGLLLAAAQSSHGRLLPGEGESTGASWWLFRSLVAIEMDPSLAKTRGDTQAADLLWSEALTRLSRERRKLPLDGVVLGVAAQSLLGPGADITATAARLRGLANEATQRLQLQLPLYVVVTGLDELPGHASFRAALPPAALRKVLGWRKSEAASAGASPGRMDGHFDDVFERMRTLGQAVLAKQHEPHGRREIFEFRQSLSDLQHGLHVFVDQLMADRVAGQHSLRWCGLYFTGVSRGDSAGGEFVEDLFNRFLPGDRLLARRTA